MNRISHWPLRGPKRLYEAPSILTEPSAAPARGARSFPILDVLAVVVVLALAAVLFLLLIWLSLDIVDPSVFRYDG